MISNNNKSQPKSRFRKLNIIDISLFSVLLISIIIFYLILIIFFYVPNYPVISDIYSVYYMIIILTVIILIRILVSIYASYLLFKIWLYKKTRAYTDLPFTFGIFFFLFIPAKLMDLIVYTVYVMYEYYGFSYFLLLNIIKLRYYIMIINILPLFLSGLYLYLIRLNLKEPDFKREKFSKRLTVLFSLFYFPTFFTITFFLSDIHNFSFIGAIITLSSLSFVTWVFITVYRGKILPEINSFIISIGFICYLISNMILPLLVNVVAPSSLEAERISGLILELGTLISMIIILLGFKIKARNK